MTPTRRIVTLIGLYVLSLGVKLIGIHDGNIQPDEVHWLLRASGVNERIAEGRWWRATTHLGHPGLPPALVMALGQEIGNGLNEHRGIKYGQPGFIDRLNSARIANAVVSSLLPPLVFAGAAPVLGPIVAGTASLLLTVEPNIVRLGRIAHVDAVMTVTVLLTVVCYFWGTVRQRLSLILLAGLFFGLSFMTKPTAGAVLIGIFIWRILVTYRGPRIPWRLEWDLWGICLSHLAFLLLYTRLWPHESDYLIRLKVHSALADRLYGTGLAMQSHPTAAVCYLGLILVAVVLSFLVWRRRLGTPADRPAARLLIHLLVMLFGAVALLGIWPASIENIVRFWTWAAGLSHVKHVAYNHVVHAPPLGYVGMLLTRLPSVIVLLAAFAALKLLRFVSPAVRRAEGLQWMLIQLLLLVIVFWIAPLSVSSKQTIRYVLPIIPFVVLLGASSLCSIRFPAGVMRPGHLSRPELIAPIAVCVLGALALFRGYPEYELFYNSLIGDLPGSFRFGYQLPIVGTREAVDYLAGEYQRTKAPIRVAVLGDVPALELTTKVRHPEARKGLSYSPDEGGIESDYLFASGWMRELGLSGPSRDILLEGNPVLAYVWEGIVVMTLTPYPWPSYDAPISLNFKLMPRATGQLLYENEADVVQPDGTIRKPRATAIELLPERDRAGFPISAYRMRFAAGSYELRARVHFTRHPERAEHEPDLPVLRISLTDECTSTLNRSDIGPDGEGTLSLKCRLDQNESVNLKVYWARGGETRLEPITVSRVP